MFQIKQNKTSGKKIHKETEMNNLPDKEFNLMVRKIPTQLRRIDGHIENFK